MSPVFHFLPWLQLEQSIEIDDLTFDHYTRPRWKEYARSDDEFRLVPKLLSNYCSSTGSPVERCTVIRQNGALFTELDESEFSRRKEFVRLLAFAALATRQLFRGPTWNSSYFVDYAQRFEGEHTYMTVVSRRREGQQMAAHPAGALRINRPFQAEHPVAKLDLAFVQALDFARTSSDAEWWTRIETAIYFFNEANTDRDDVPVVKELVDVFTAFECLLNQRNSTDRLAHAFAGLLAPADELHVVNTARVGLSNRGGANARTQAVRFQWIRDLGTARDNVAHGRLDSNPNQLWSSPEHLVLAAISFPLVVKLMLSDKGFYEATDDDRAQIEAFEHLADSDFMKQPEDASHSEDYIWNRLQREFYRNRRVEERVRAAIEKLRNRE